tara:strand:- start:549 stop:722 length:174 start_codon:yes stop_codon:yes gene_type:complete
MRYESDNLSKNELQFIVAISVGSGIINHITDKPLFAMFCGLSLYTTMMILYIKLKYT